VNGRKAGAKIHRAVEQSGISTIILASRAMAALSYGARNQWPIKGISVLALAGLRGATLFGLRPSGYRALPLLRPQIGPFPLWCAATAG